MSRRLKALFVPNYVAVDLERIVNEPDSGVKKDGVEFDREATFHDGCRMAIQVCASGDPANEPCWTQGVLFSPEGHELGCTGPGESFLGEYCVTHEGTDYIVLVDADVALA